MLESNIEKLIKVAIKSLQKQGAILNFNLPEIKIEIPTDKNNGDFATNAPMILARIAKKPPMAIAELLIKELQIGDKKYFSKIEAVPPGFINFFASQEYLFKELSVILKQKNKYGSGKEGMGKTVVIDYSSPNIAKSFGVGHLRSTIIGQSIYNIYKFLGWKCIGDNHLGDWGTQFGKLIVAIKKWGKGNKNLSINDLEKLYIKFHKEVEVTPELEDLAREEFKKLESNDTETNKIWKKCVDISLKEFERIYKILNIKIDHALGESFYQPMLNEIILKAKKRKVVIESQGALIIKFPNDILPPAMLLKSDGATTYLTRDLAAIKYRLKKWKPNIIIYEVGADQILHFRQLFLTAELLGLAKKETFFHVAHGLMRSAEGKFSTRKGQTIHLEGILTEAIERAEQIIRQSQSSKNLKEKEIKKIANQVGVGAIKYNDLKQKHSSDIIFDWEKILNFKGNAGPYLQYTFTRCSSVLGKAGIDLDGARVDSVDMNRHEEEILRIILGFSGVVRESAKRFSPNLICDFTFELAKSYNTFYDSYPILSAENKDLKIFRLIITSATAQVLKNALYLLGIETPEKM